MYNTFVTAFAVGGFGVWDQDIALNRPEELPLIELLFPFVYRHTKENEKFTLVKFILWTLISISHSFVVFAFPMMIYDEFMLKGGKEMDIWACSLLGYFTVVHLHYAMLTLFINNYNAWNIFYMVGSYLIFFFIFQVV
mmetsp:Transcript_30488/g.29882  ORF Transcript_30488/g.29882 Transcript_30488/m.29882 type:complete len:138 (-) Transcript_30488:482-895(-)